MQVIGIFATLRRSLRVLGASGAATNARQARDEERRITLELEALEARLVNNGRYAKAA